MGERAARALARAETRLRARGLTGAQAFDVLLPALEAVVGGGAANDDPVAVALADELRTDAADGEAVDLLGLAYERFFADLFKGLRGQFFTPPAIGALLVAHLGTLPGATVLDPTCGSGGLLTIAARAGARVRGIELDPRLARLAAVNLRLAGVPAPDVRTADFFAAEVDTPVDAIVANPPFSVPIEDPDVLARFDAGRGRRQVASDRLFVEAIGRWVRPGGAAGIVLPFSVLANPSWADVRARIDAEWVRRAVCALPEGVFRPFGGAAGRAVLLWLVRRPGVDVPAPRYATLADPGYDVRSSRLRATDPAEVDALVRGEGFEPLPDGAWTPPGGGEGVAVGSVARVRRNRAGRAGPVWVADLAHADRMTGEVHPVAAGVPGPRVRIGEGDVLVAQLRPNLGNVALAPPVDGELVGSPEWIVLEGTKAPGYLLHALRTPAWRAALPVAHGQTRPRIGPDTVLASAIRWPPDALAARIDALSRGVFAERRRLRQVLVDLQGLVDAYAAGEIDDEALARGVAALDPHGAQRVTGSGGQGDDDGAVDGDGSARGGGGGLSRG